jgi:hypothetical protein
LSLYQKSPIGYTAPNRKEMTIMPFKSKLALLILTLLLLSSSLTTACQSQTAASTEGHTHEMADLEGMPYQVKQAPVTVQEAYRFAVANPDILSQLPCYCGCGGMGHHSNYACYVAGLNEDGTVQYDTHAVGCSICVDITQDTMRLLKEGKSTAEIKAYVDATYARYGPSNME